MMIKSLPICHDHKDLIHDIAYDYYGKRIATCSSDQSVKVWDLNEDDQWVLSASWKVHSGSVWKIDWAHPEFGQLLATCSFDRTAIIWEEIISEATPSTGGAGSGSTGSKTLKHWIKRSGLVDSRSNVTDVKFAPRHLGLLVATCSHDGVVRIYEANDIMNLAQWSVQHEITSSKLRCSCIAWNPSPYHSPLLAVGSDDPTIAGAKINIYERKESTRKWVKVESLVSFTDPVYDLEFANNIGRSYHMLAVAAKSVHIIQVKPLASMTVKDAPESNTKFEVRQVAQFDDHEGQVWRVSWNVTGTILASCGADGTVRLYKANYMGNWRCTNVFKQKEGNVYDVGPKSSASTFE